HVGDGLVTVLVHAFVGRSSGEARASVEAPFRDYLQTVIRVFHPSPAVIADAEDVESLTARGFERFFERDSLIGTPESAMRFVATAQAIGVDELACLIDFGVDA